MMFSILSQGYGTYDGTAKKDAQEIPEQKDYFSLEDLHLPPIGSNYRAPPPVEVSEYQTGPRYENKPFQLPKVENTKQSVIHVPKTYTTRKGALLLYAEDFFLPGSPKPRKKRRKIKKQTSLKLRTMNDLRNFILDYKNGGDPLFLALLQKRLSGYRDSVRPGFSPKRYIATLGNSLQEDTWNRLAAAGSIKDPTLLAYDPKLTPMHGGAGTSTLFPNKPQPYSTMSLPPLSPSSSMFDSSFHFYKNGMSTGAASMISLNSETEEYAPSSRALSPAESLSNRLPEVELLPQRKDPYAKLNAKEKEDLLSQLLLQKTLASDLSDLQGWVTNYADHRGEVEQDPASMMTLQKSKAKHRGSLKSGSLTSIPRLPPIQSAGTRPTTPVDLTEERSSVHTSDDIKADEQNDYSSKEGERDDILDPGSIQVDLSSFDKSSSLANQHVLSNESIHTSEEATNHVKEEESERDDSTHKMNQSLSRNTSEEAMEPLDIARDDDTVYEPEEASSSEDSITDQGVTQSDTVIALDDIVLSDDTAQGDIQVAVQDVEMEGDAEYLATEGKESSSRAEGGEAHSEMGSAKGAAQADKEGPLMTEEADVEPGEVRSDDEDEGIGLEGEELDDNSRQEADEGSNQADGTVIVEEGSETPELVEPPPPISFEELQGAARSVANRVLSRPQSGMVFMEDARTAIAMWADRLTNLLGPPQPDARVSSAKQRPGPATQGVISRPTRHRKVSRSAGPSLPALRKALLISGGEIPEIEALKNLPPLPERFAKAGPPHPPSGVSSGHSRRKALKDGSASTKGSASSGAARSIPWERISNTDLQADVFSYATMEPTLQRLQADEIADEESDEEDGNEFRTALDAVVTEVKPDYIEAQSRMAIASPKKDQQPFKFPRPAPTKPPAGLKNKQATGQAKAKAKPAPPKKAPPAKKKAGKKPAKQAKPSKPAKATKGKAEAPKKEEQQEKVEEVKEEVKVVEEAQEETSEVIRVDSETGEREPEISDRTAMSSVVSRDTSARISSKASDELAENKNDEPVETAVSSVPEIPRMVPKPPEPQVVPEVTPEAESAPEQPSPAQEQKQPQESRAARRAAERAAAAERRRQEVERKRKEREEAKKRALEEEARLEQLRLDAEEEMKKREEERRLRRQEKEAAKQRERDEELERERQAKAKAEKERRARDEWKKRQQLVIAHRKLEEELRREQEKIEAEIEAARLREEEERIKAMEESERIAFLEKMRQEEEELRQRLEEQKRRDEEERRIREEEKKQRDEALALLRQKQLQRHLFVAGLLKESQYLALGQRLTKAFTFSYFDLLPWNDLQHLIPPPSPVRDLFASVRDNIPPTIEEEDENIDED